MCLEEQGGPWADLEQGGIPILLPSRFILACLSSGSSSPGPPAPQLQPLCHTPTPKARALIGD